MPPYKHRIGLLVLVDDATIEPEFNELAPEGVAVHAARMMYDPSYISPESLAKLELQVEKAVSEVLWVHPNVIVFACTSGSLIIGDEKLIQKINNKAPGVPATTTITAVTHALRALGIRTLAVGTPYTDDVNIAEKKYLEDHDFKIANIEGLEIRDGPTLSLQEVDTIYNLAKRVNRPEADGVFLSCTGLHAISVIEKLELELGKPVISSNLATFWHSCKLAGIRGAIEGYGRLLRML